MPLRQWFLDNLMINSPGDTHRLVPMVISAVLMMSEDSPLIRQTSDSITFHGSVVCASVSLDGAGLCIFDSKTNATVFQNMSIVTDMSEEEFRNQCLGLIDEVHSAFESEAHAKKEKLKERLRAST